MGSEADQRVAVAEALYSSMHAMDPEGLLSLLDEDFVGHVSEGLGEIGGTYEGAGRMLAEVWLPAYQTYGVLPHPEEFLVCDEDRVLVLGRYKGTPPSTGRDFEAVFAHVLEIRDGRICGCRQITDSARWLEALRGA